VGGIEEYGGEASAEEAEDQCCGPQAYYRSHQKAVGGISGEESGAGPK